MESSAKSEIIEAIKSAGVVGAGGAGFPTHIKAASMAEYVIANGAECEPLVRCNQELLLKEPEKVVAGLELMVEATGAKQGIIAIKRKNKAAASLEKLAAEKEHLRIHYLKDFYPAGDEHVLVYEVTGRVVPEGGIPLAVGAVVSNVESLYNVAAAVGGQPVTDKMVTVTGAVQVPVTVRVPLGTAARELLALAGGPTVTDYAVIEGGPMMGKLVEEDAPVTKTTGAFIVLPAEHPVVSARRASWRTVLGRAKAVCCQCRFCTDLCPRYLLGHGLEPHRVTQLVAYGIADATAMTRALLCSECGLCEAYACPMGLSPRYLHAELKRELGRQGIKHPGGLPEVLRPDPWREYRRVPVPRLVARLGLAQFDRPAPFQPVSMSPASVTIPLKQHVGLPCVPTVSVGERVSKGQVVGTIPEGSLGAVLRASMDGLVTEVTDRDITIEALA
ncbi:NADH dehydrogenase [Clostridiales bacterium PH28_bin88]|nr:NADH dehydrogenase [Clostridiales bacterium PH28_bin88]